MVCHLKRSKYICRVLHLYSIDFSLCHTHTLKHTWHHLERTLVFQTLSVVLDGMVWHDLSELGYSESTLSKNFKLQNKISSFRKTPQTHWTKGGTKQNMYLDLNHIVLRGLQLGAMGWLQHSNSFWGSCPFSPLFLLSWPYQGLLWSRPASNLRKSFHSSEVSSSQQTAHVLTSPRTNHTSYFAYQQPKVTVFKSHHLI